MILGAVINAIGMGPVIHKRSHRSAVKLALSDCRSRSSSMSAVKRALELAASGTATKLERDTWKRIERRRRDLLELTEMVEDIDYGAGHPGSEYTEEQQRSGVVTTITVRELASVSLHSIWAEVLFYLTRILRPKKALELGTCVGISGSYIAMAMQFNDQGRLWTIEGSPATASLAQKTFQMLGLNDRVTSLVGQFRDELGPCLRDQNSFDLVFVDGHHDGVATLGYFEQLKPHLSPNAVVLFDDIVWYAEMAEAWNKISADPSVKDFVRLGGMGATVF